MARNVNSSNRQTMGTTALASATTRRPLKGKLVKSRLGKSDTDPSAGTATHRRGVLERLGPSYKIVPSFKTPDPSGASAATQSNGRIIPSALGNRDQFFSPPSEGAGVTPARGTWSPPNRGKTSA